jgi:hypothetical protein
MARMGGEWPRWAGGGAKVTRLKRWRIKGLGAEPESASPHLAKDARYGAPNIEIPYAVGSQETFGALLWSNCGSGLFFSPWHS